MTMMMTMMVVRHEFAPRAVPRGCRFGNRPSSCFPLLVSMAGGGGGGLSSMLRFMASMAQGGPGEGDVGGGEGDDGWVVSPDLARAMGGQTLPEAADGTHTTEGHDDEDDAGRYGDDNGHQESMGDGE